MVRPWSLAYLLLVVASLLQPPSGAARPPSVAMLSGAYEDATMLEAATGIPPLIRATHDRRVRALIDTVYFGGSGTGDGSVVRGGRWDWEADSGETPLFFPDGDPVGNQFRDGWTFVDLTSRHAPAAIGAGHWRPDGSYAFEDPTGGFAHRASTHANDGVDDGPDPLDSPYNPASSDWSVWIGTNLYLNPEHCGWARTAGYGDGWTQGIQKAFAIDAPPSTPVALTFYHRYAVEAGFDTCWVEISSDGLLWSQVGDAAAPHGIYAGGTKAFPAPAPDGGLASVPLLDWPGGTDSLWVRLRIASDSFYSDEADGGLFFYAWQIDDLALLADGVPIDVADFESGMDGWQPMRFAGQDAGLTLDPALPAGRIAPLADLACPPELQCPEMCGIDGNVLLFADRDDCELLEAMVTGVVSPPFAIGGASQPDVDGWAGRLIVADLYVDGGSGLFAPGVSLCHYHNPAGLNACPYTPPPGAPGGGITFDWSRTSTATCDYWSSGVGATCLNTFTDDVSANLPASADSVILQLAVTAYEHTAPPGESVTPFFDNVRFAVYDPSGLTIDLPTIGRYSDSFPLAAQAHAGLDPGTSRSDGAQSFPCQLGIEMPFRHVRADTAFVQCSPEIESMYLRFRVDPGSCQSLAHPFWSAYAAGSWHEARMDVGHLQGSGTPVAGTFMTCFHPEDPYDGTSWGGEMSAVEPCDDILPDGVFSPGTRVVYFFEARDATTGEVLGTAPSLPGGAPLDTTASFAARWLEFETLPELSSQLGCDPTNPDHYVNDLLVIDDSGRDRPAARVRTLLDHFALDYDWYDVEGTNYTCSYNGIGRREDRNMQPPRPPVGGAAAAQLEGYRGIWYFADHMVTNTLTDELTHSIFGGQPSIDQQRLEGWLQACSSAPPHENRLLLLEGLGWASDIDAHTVHGPTFLANLGIDLIDDSYCEMTDDLRRCARITGTPAIAPDLDAEVFGLGCPECYPADVLSAIGGGETVASFVHSLEGGNDPVDCSDDVDHPEWAAIVRRATGTQGCQRSVAMGIGTPGLHTLNCIDQCLFGEWTAYGALGRLVVGLFDWAGLPISTTGLEESPPPATPVAVTRLVGARPNPANPRVTIRFTLAARGHVQLRVYDVGGRHVRTLVDTELDPDPAGYEAQWDGRDAAGRRVSSGVYFYQLDAPGYSAARKLVLLE